MRDTSNVVELLDAGPSAQAKRRQRWALLATKSSAQLNRFVTTLCSRRGFAPIRTTAPRSAHRATNRCQAGFGRGCPGKPSVGVRTQKEGARACRPMGQGRSRRARTSPPGGQDAERGGQDEPTRGSGPPLPRTDGPTGGREIDPCQSSVQRCPTASEPHTTTHAKRVGRKVGWQVRRSEVKQTLGARRPRHQTAGGSGDVCACGAGRRWQNGCAALHFRERRSDRPDAARP